MKPKGLAKYLLGTSALTAAIVVSSVSPTASAATQTYDDANVDNFWDLSTLNWNASTAVWTNGNNATFGGTGEFVSVEDSIIVDNITFSSTGYTLGDGSGDLTMFDGNSDITVNSGTATIGETIAGGGSLTKLGTGTLALSGANTYTGGTSITGILSANNSSALGTGAVTINAAGGNQLQLSDGLNINNALTINGGGVTAQGAVYLASGNSTLSGTINITAAAALGGHFATGGQTSTLTIAGNNTITSATPVTIRNGIVKITGSQSYTGGTTLANAGAMVHFAKAASMPASGTVALSTGTTLGVNVGGAGEFTTTGTGAGTIAGLLTGTGGQGAAVTLAAGSSLAIDTTNAVGNQVLSTAFNSTNSAGLLKLGTGTLELSAGGTYGGAGYGGFPLIVRQGTLLLSGGTHTANGETVIGGTFGTANGDVGYDAKLQIDSGSLAINNWLSVGRGNGIGTVSSDLVLNNAATVSATNLSAGYNGGSALNMPKGTITLNNSSTLTITGNGAFYIAESAGSNFTATLNGTSQLVVAGTGAHRIGNVDSTGALTLNGSSTATFGGTTSVGYGNGSSGTVTINNGATLNANNFNIAESTAATNALTGLVTVQSGGNLKTSGDVVVGLGGTQTGQLIINGTVSVGTTAEKWLKVGAFDSVAGQLDLNSGGTLNLNTNTDIRFTTNGGAGLNVINQNGGNVVSYSNNGVTLGGSTVLDMNNAGAAGSNNTYNLNGGTLAISQVMSTATTGTRTFNFNGGTLKVASNLNAANFFNLGTGGTTLANVRNGGAIVDTNGISVTMAQALAHSNIGGDNAIDGGLTKSGLGTLTLSSAANTYTGGTLISAGTLATAATGNLGTGNVTVTATGGLTLGNGSSIADTATLFFGAGAAGAIALNNSSSETVFGVTQTDDSQSIGGGTFTAAQLNSFFGVTSFTGTGTLTVVPEPSAALLGGLGVLGLLRRRRNA